MSQQELPFNRYRVEERTITGWRFLGFVPAATAAEARRRWHARTGLSEFGDSIRAVNL